MKHIKILLKNIGWCLLALCIPSLLAIETIQSRRYNVLENQVKTLENSQNELIESNKRFITDIGLASSSSRIEKIAIEEFGMHLAESSEIIRVEIQGTKTNIQGHNDGT